MKTPPTLAEVTSKLEEIIAENVDFERPLPYDRPLMVELGFDSLDMIETSFTIQEYFDFEFSDKNAIEELDNALGKGSLVLDGKITALGREMVLERMPELARLDLPEELTPLELQRYYTLETFGRLVLEFLQAVPQGESISWDELRPRLANGEPAPVPTGDVLIEQWVERTTEALRERV